MAGTETDAHVAGSADTAHMVEIGDADTAYAADDLADVATLVMVTIGVIGDLGRVDASVTLVCLFEALVDLEDLVAFDTLVDCLVAVDPSHVADTWYMFDVSACSALGEVDTMRGVGAMGEIDVCGEVDAFGVVDGFSEIDTFGKIYVLVVIAILDNADISQMAGLDELDVPDISNGSGTLDVTITSVMVGVAFVTYAAIVSAAAFIVGTVYVVGIATGLHLPVPTGKRVAAPFNRIDGAAQFTDAVLPTAGSGLFLICSALDNSVAVLTGITYLDDVESVLIVFDGVESSVDSSTVEQFLRFELLWVLDIFELVDVL